MQDKNIKKFKEFVAELNQNYSYVSLLEMADDYIFEESGKYDFSSNIFYDFLFDFVHHCEDRSILYQKITKLNDLIHQKNNFSFEDLVYLLFEEELLNIKKKYDFEKISYKVYVNQLRKYNNGELDVDKLSSLLPSFT